MKIKFFILLLFGSILSAVDVSEEVLATGYGIDQKQALENAFKAAVKENIAVIVDSEIMLANDEIIKNEILANANDYIDDYNIVKTNVENSLYEITIKASLENKNIKEKVSSLNIVTKDFTENKEALKASEESKAEENKAPSEVKNLTKAEIQKEAWENIREFMENIKKEASSFMELELTKVDLDLAQIKNGKFPYNFDYKINYNYELYNKMIAELEEKFSQLGFKVKRRAAIINDYESTYSVKDAIYKDYGEIMGNQLAIVKKTDGKFSVDIWDLPFNLPRCNFDISKIRIYYELLNGKEVLDFGYENLPKHNYICYNIYYNFYLPYWLNIDAAFTMKHYTKPFIESKIKATANLENLNPDELKDLTVKIVLQEK